MDPNYFPIPDNLQADAWNAAWEPWGDVDAEGNYPLDYHQLALRAVQLGRDASALIDATLDQFAQFRPMEVAAPDFSMFDMGAGVKRVVNTVIDYAAASHQFHDFQAGEHVKRPSDIFDDDELLEGAEPINYLSLKTGEVPGKDLMSVVRSTNFQRHWAGMVRAEFVGYWGSRAEQLCAARWLRQQLKAADVRDAHIAAAIPMILSLAKLPTEDEDAAAAFERSDAFRAVTGRLPWTRRFVRWICGKKYIAQRKTVFVQSG